MVVAIRVLLHSLKRMAIAKSAERSLPLMDIGRFRVPGYSRSLPTLGVQ
jgi:hypothetical protein